MNKRLKLVMLCLFVLSMAMLIAGCVPGDGSNTEEKKAGFISGVWHGWIAPISLILGFFDKNVRVYEVFNKGWGYDFGFYIAIISGFGGISFFRKKRRR